MNCGEFYILSLKWTRSGLRDSRFWGANEAYWIAYYAFCHDVVGVRYDPARSAQLDLWAEVSRSASWWWPYRWLCFVADRPAEVHWETDRERPRLHRTAGPVLRFRDGWEVYAVRGVRMSTERGQAMASGLLTAQQIRDEPNAEVRRVLMGVYNGDDPGRWARDVGATILHEDVDPMGRPRRLLRYRFAKRELALESPRRTEPRSRGLFESLTSCGTK